MTCCPLQQERVRFRRSKPHDFLFQQKNFHSLLSKQHCYLAGISGYFPCFLGALICRYSRFSEFLPVAVFAESSAGVPAVTDVLEVGVCCGWSGITIATFLGTSA
jgi:hypothetical protein